MKLFLMFSGFVFSLIFSTSGQTILVLQPGPDDGKDAMINSAYPDNNWGESSGLYASAWTYQGFFGIGRSPMQFDLSQIPTWAQIIDARLTLFYDPDYAFGLQYGENASYLDRITEDWDEMSVTWNTIPSTTSVGSVFIPKTQTETEDIKNVDVTSFVSNWVKHPETNFGFMHRMAVEIEYCGVFYSSSDKTVASKRPKLVVTYLACDPPIAAFAANVIIPVVSFTDSSSHASSWFWDFGDGYFANIQNPVHAYAQLGTYQVCLTISDSCGSDTICKPVSVCNNPATRFGYIAEGNMIKFADSSVDPQSWFWDFGDGFYSDLRDPEHYFNEWGTYYVCEKVVNACSEETFCDSVTVTGTGISEQTRRFDLKIWPNPASDITWLQIKSRQGSKINIELYSAQMSLIGKWEFAIPSQEARLPLHLDEYPAGLYFLRSEVDGFFRLDKLVIH
jgi:PKD repeat protein